MTIDQEAIETVIAAIKQSKKYRDTSEETIRQLAVEAVATHKKARPAEKAVRRRLHSIMAPTWAIPTTIRPANCSIKPSSAAMRPPSAPSAAT